MGLFSVSGTVTAIGQSVFDNDMTIYAFVQLTDRTGRRVSVQKVAVCNDVAAELGPGVEGEFYFDDIFVSGRKLHHQMWGLKSDGVTVLDTVDLRKMVTVMHLVKGILLTPVLGAGIVELVAGIRQLFWLLCHPGARKTLFYGLDPVTEHRLRAQQPVRL